MDLLPWHSWWANLKPQHCAWNSGALLICFLSCLQSVLKRRKTVLLSVSTCVLSPSSAGVRVTPWAFLWGPSLCHIHFTDVFRCHQLGGHWCGDPPHCSTITSRLCASYVNGLRCTWLPLSLITLQLADYGNASLRRFCLTEHLLCSGTCLHWSVEYLKRLVLADDMTVSVSCVLS